MKRDKRQILKDIYKGKTVVYEPFGKKSATVGEFFRVVDFLIQKPTMAVLRSKKDGRRFNALFSAVKVYKPKLKDPTIKIKIRRLKALSLLNKIKKKGKKK